MKCDTGCLRVLMHLLLLAFATLFSAVLFGGSLIADIESGNLDAVRSQVNAGADINAIDNKQGAPLHVAAKSGHLPIVEFLLDNEADLTARIPKSDKSPLHVAAQAGHVDVVELLLSRGAELEQKDKKGETPIFSAILKNQVAVLRVLIEQGANLNVVSRFKDTPANKAVALGKVESTELLLKNGAVLDLDRVVEKKCSKCHGMDGRSKAPFSPNLASMGEEYLVQQFKDYQSGAREHEKMDSRLTGGIADSVLVMLAEYYAAKPPIDLDADPEAMASGKLLYEAAPTGAKACADCHASDGAATASDLPRVASQNAQYLAIQLRGYRDGTRSNDKDGVMRSVMAGASDSHIEQLAAYLQGI